MTSNELSSNYASCNSEIYSNNLYVHSTVVTVNGVEIEVPWNMNILVNGNKVSFVFKSITTFSQNLNNNQSVIQTF